MQRVVVKAQARVHRKVRCAYQSAGRRRLGRGVGAAVGPAVQGAHNVSAGIACGVARSALGVEQRAAAFQNQRLAVAADVGDQLNAAAVVHQGAALVLVGQGVKIAKLRHA